MLYLVCIRSARAIRRVEAMPIGECTNMDAVRVDAESLG
jgi:hypothetical protein